MCAGRVGVSRWRILLAAEKPPPPDRPDDDAVGAAMARIVASEAFRDSPQLRAFLAYIVKEALAGRAADLKGYSIATQALGRPTSFDPQTDPIVRVQAGRLRQALTEYYAANPQADVVIRLEKGTYAPAFLRGPAPTAAGSALPTAPATPRPASGTAVEPAAAAAPTRRIAVLSGMAAVAAAGVVYLAASRSSAPPPAAPAAAPPMPAAEHFYPSLSVEADPTSSYAGVSTMAARLRDAMARFDDLIVVAEADSADMRPAARVELTRPPGRDLMLRVAAQMVGADRIRLVVRLLDRRDNRVVWSREFDPFPVSVDGEAQRLSIVRAVATTVAQPYGVIHAHVRARLEGTAHAADPYGCLVAGFDYWQTNDRATHSAARKCFVDRIKDHPGNAALHAQLTYLHLEEFRHGYNLLPGDPLARALDEAQIAVRLAPASARSHQALLAALFSRRDMEGAWRAANEALALNPFDTDVIADIGARHIQAGRFERGLAMIKEAFELNTAPPVWARTYQAIALYMLNRVDESSIIAAQLETTRFPPAMVATLLVAYRQRNLVKAKERLALLRATHPAVAADFGSYLHRLNVSDLVLERSVSSYNDAVAWTDGT